MAISRLWDTRAHRGWNENNMLILSREMPYQDGTTELTGYLTWDDSREEGRPGVLIVHGGAGLDDHAKGRARTFAAQGYIAFACDMYGNGIVSGGRARIMPLILRLCAAPEKLCNRAKAALDVLTAHPLVDRRVAAIGYCFGGMTVLELARHGADLDAVISVHGSLQPAETIARAHVPVEPSTEPGAAKAGPVRTPIRPRILVCHGALDPHVPMSHVTAFAEEMGQASANWQLNIYGGAQHGFTHETAATAPGVAYHAEADTRSSADIHRFLASVFS